MEVVRRLLILALLGAASAGAQGQAEPPNAVLLVARPDLVDPNFRRTVVLVTQAPDASTVGVILNRPGPKAYFGGPVMREVMVAVFRSERAPEASAFRVLHDVYLTMHPQLIGQLAGQYRLYAGFSGWSPGQLESELKQDSWYVLPASEDVLFRTDTTGLWEEMVRKARRKVALR